MEGFLLACGSCIAELDACATALKSIRRERTLGLSRSEEVEQAALAGECKELQARLQQCAGTMLCQQQYEALERAKAVGSEEEAFRKRDFLSCLRAEERSARRTMLFF